MKLSIVKYTLELRHVFSISHSSRRTTPTVLIKIKDGDNSGFGEASLPPYLVENQESVSDLLKNIELKSIESVDELNDWMDWIDNELQGNYAAKAALNIAMNDLIGKNLGMPCHELYGIIFSFFYGILFCFILIYFFYNWNRFE